MSKYKYKIGEALLQAHPNVKTICNIQPVSGELRTRKLDIIAGENRTETMHKEYGAIFYLDVAKTFFSPRLATERRRIASMIQNGEMIVDMFTGVAPFSILIAKYAHPDKIYAIDKNRDAVIFAKRNICLNKVEDIVDVIHGDSSNTKQILGNIKVDRVIMNLPFSAYNFFPYALQSIKPKSVIHYYSILREEFLDDHKKSLEDIASRYMFKLSFSDIRRIKTYAPREFYIGMDITAVHKADVA